MANSKGGGQRATQVLLASLVVLIVAFVVLLRSTYRPPGADEVLRLDRLYRLADDGQVLTARLLDEDSVVLGTRCSEVPPLPYDPQATTPPAARCPGQVTTFRVAYPQSDVATQQLIDRISASAALEVDPQGAKSVTKLILTFIFPLALLANLFGIIFMSKSGESSISDIVGFGRIGRKRQARKRKGAPGSGITFADVAGADEAVTELREVTEYLTDPKRFEEYGAAAPKGVLLFGPPGCGKTLLARAVAGESGVAFFSISGADFVESLVGVGAARVRDLFTQVREDAPAIVFIDEIDAVGRRREGEGTSGGEREQTVNQLLVEMDGFEVSAGIVIMAATNRPDILDPALLRPGRFDRHVTVTPPDLAGRRAILELHGANKRLAPDVDFDLLARRTPGFTGADLANVINEGALLAIRQGGGAVVDNAHLSEAVLRVLHGPQRRGRIMTPDERLRLAVHEAGHAVMAAAAGRSGDLHRLSIVARGRGLGQSMVSDDADRVLLTASDMGAQLATAMGGIAAEVMAFGESSTTAEDDIDRATDLARQMVGRYGMSPAIGRLRLMHGFDGFLGGQASMEMLSGQTMHDFDVAVKELVARAEELATQVLNHYRGDLERLVQRLDAAETLEGAELEQLLAGVRPGLEAFGPERNGHDEREPEPEYEEEVRRREWSARDWRSADRSSRPSVRR